MRIQLPDVNVLVALHNPLHTLYERAHAWFESEGQHGWATCPLTENGFVRVFAQTKYPNDLKGVPAALHILENMVKTYANTHQFWTDSVSLRDSLLFMPSAIAGPKQITDIYLLGLCHQNAGTLVTLDAGITPTAIFAHHPELLRTL